MSGQDGLGLYVEGWSRGRVRFSMGGGEPRIVTVDAIEAALARLQRTSDTTAYFARNHLDEASLIALRDFAREHAGVGRR